MFSVGPDACYAGRTLSLFRRRRYEALDCLAPVWPRPRGVHQPHGAVGRSRNGSCEVHAKRTHQITTERLYIVALQLTSRGESGVGGTA